MMKICRSVFLAVAFAILVTALIAGISPRQVAAEFHGGKSAGFENPTCATTRIDNHTMKWSASCLQISIIDRGHIEISLPQDSSTPIAPNRLTQTYGMFEGTWVLNEKDYAIEYCMPGFKCSGPSVDGGNNSLSLLSQGELSPDQVNSLFNSNYSMYIGGLSNNKNQTQYKQLFGQDVCSGSNTIDFTVSGWYCGGTAINDDWVASHYTDAITNLGQNLDTNSLDNFNILYRANSDATVLTSVFNDAEVNQGKDLTPSQQNLVWCAGTNRYILTAGTATCSNTATSNYVDGVTPTTFQGSGTAQITIKDGKTNGVISTSLVAKSNNTPPTPPAGRCPDGSTDPQCSIPDPELKCSASLLNPLSWLACPIIFAANQAINTYDDQIQQQLDVESNTYLNETKAKVGGSYYQIWSAVRYIAMSLLVLIGLIMVISQAIGSDLFDAYTVRKILPRLIAAVILVALSWPLAKYMIDASDVLGKGIRTIIYFPFRDTVATLHTSVGADGLLSLGGLAGAAALSMAGILLLALSALLAVFAAIVTLVVRKILIIFLVVLAPIAIVAYILPGTQRVWKMWWDNFLKLLLMFPIIMAFIAAGRVFAITAQNTEKGILGQIIMFIAYFGPYFALPLTFKMGGGLMSMAAGGIRGISQMGTKRFNAAAGNIARERHQERMAGKRGLIGSRGGNVYRRAASFGTHGSWNPTRGGRRRWEDYRQLLDERTGAKMIEEGGARGFNDDDASAVALRAVSRRDFINRYVAMGHSQQEAQAALARAEQATGALMGTSAMQAAAGRFRIGMTNTGYESGEAGLRQLQADAQYMVSQGLTTYNDVAGWMKSNRGRADYSANSYGDTVAFLQGDQTARQQIAGAYKGADPREVVGGHQRAVETFAEQARINFEDAVNNFNTASASGDATQIAQAQYDLDIASADVAGVYDVMGHSSPNKAQEFANNVLGRGVQLGDQTTTIRAVMEQSRNRPPGTHGEQTFLERRREWTTAQGARAAREAEASIEPPDNGGPGGYF